MAFKIGDVVELKSGGPRMTVTGHGQDGNGNVRANCTWFDKDHNEKNGAFPPEALERYKERIDSGGGTDFEDD